MKNDLHTLFAEYLEECRYTRRLSLETVRGYREVWKNFTQQMPEIRSADDLRQFSATTFFRRLENRRRLVGTQMKRTGVKASTVATYGRRLRCFFEWLRVQKIIAENPINLESLPKPAYHDNRALKRREIEKIIAAITQSSKNTFLLRRDLAMVNVFLYCGLRRSELLRLKVCDVDAVRGTIEVNGITSKSKRTRTIPVARVALQSIDEYLKARKERGYTCAYLWTSDNRDRRFTEHGLKHWVTRIARLSGQTFHVHQFRHSCACGLAKNKNNIALIKKFLGHGDLRMTETYLRSLGVDDMKESLSDMSLASFD